MKRIKGVVGFHILFLTVLLLYILVLNLFEIGCPLRYLFGVSCPGCGGSRAIMALFRWDIEGYFYYHPLALPLGGAIVLMLHAHLLQKQKKKTVTAIGVTVVVMNFILFLWRAANGLIP